MILKIKPLTSLRSPRIKLPLQSLFRIIGSKDNSYTSKLSARAATQALSSKTWLSQRLYHSHFPASPISQGSQTLILSLLRDLPLYGSLPTCSRLNRSLNLISLREFNANWSHQSIPVSSSSQYAREPQHTTCTLPVVQLRTSASVPGLLNFQGSPLLLSSLPLKRLAQSHWLFLMQTS